MHQCGRWRVHNHPVPAPGENGGFFEHSSMVSPTSPTLMALMTMIPFMTRMTPLDLKGGGGGGGGIASLAKPVRVHLLPP